MDRRDALKSLGAIAASAGLTVTPVTTKEARAAELIILKLSKPLNMDGVARLKELWTQALKGTSLESTRTVILSEGVEVEVVTGSRG